MSLSFRAHKTYYPFDEWTHTTWSLCIKQYEGPRDEGLRDRRIAAARSLSQTFIRGDLNLILITKCTTYPKKAHFRLVVLASVQPEQAFSLSLVSRGLRHYVKQWAYQILEDICTIALSRKVWRGSSPSTRICYFSVFLLLLGEILYHETSLSESWSL